MESQLTKLTKQRSSADLQMMTKESIKWLSQRIADIRSPSSIPNQMNREKSRQTTKFTMGGMYCFYYNPKGKEEMPYYDRFPMVLVLERYNDGFLGLNLHYLPLQYRVAFLGKLLKFATYDDNNEIQRLRVTYDILQASRRLREFRPCIKRYLTGQIQSKLLAIQPNEWDIAAFLPIQQFRGATAQHVWQESVEEIRKP